MSEGILDFTRRRLNEEESSLRSGGVCSCEDMIKGLQRLVRAHQILVAATPEKDQLFAACIQVTSELLLAPIAEIWSAHPAFQPDWQL